MTAPAVGIYGHHRRWAAALTRLALICSAASCAESSFVDKYCDWRTVTAPGASDRIPAGDFEPVTSIFDKAWRETVSYLEQAWRKTLL